MKIVVALSMKIFTVSVTLLLFTSNYVIGQIDDSTYYDDTLIGLEEVYKISPPQKPVFVDHLDSVKGEIVDTLSSFNAYLKVGEKGMYDKSWFILVPEYNRYQVFYIWNDYVSFDWVTVVDSQQADVNGDGFDEVVLSWENYAGHSGWENSVHERHGGILIWDLKNGQCLFDFENFFQLEHWWAIYEEDTTNTLAYEDREVVEIGGEYECDYFNVTIQTKEIHIQWSYSCGGRKEKAIAPAQEIPTYIYDLKDTRFVLRQ